VCPSIRFDRFRREFDFAKFVPDPYRPARQSPVKTTISINFGRYLRGGTDSNDLRSVSRADSANVCYHLIALPITIGSVRYPGIKIHETRFGRGIPFTFLTSLATRFGRRFRICCCLEGGEDGLMDLLGRPAADVRAALDRQLSERRPAVPDQGAMYRPHKVANRRNWTRVKRRRS
jgi:hypothetical protein